MVRAASRHLPSYVDMIMIPEGDQVTLSNITSFLYTGRCMGVLSRKEHEDMMMILQNLKGMSEEDSRPESLAECRCRDCFLARPPTCLSSLPSTLPTPNSTVSTSYTPSSNHPSTYSPPATSSNSPPFSQSPGSRSPEAIPVTSHGDSTAIVTVGDSIAVGQNLHTVVVVCPQDPDGDGLPATDEGETDQVVSRCDVENCVFSTERHRDLKRHKESQSCPRLAERALMCPYCGEGPKTQAALTSHLKRFRCPRQFKCSNHACDSAFSTARKLKEHMSDH